MYIDDSPQQSITFPARQQVSTTNNNNNILALFDNINKTLYGGYNDITATTTNGNFFFAVAARCSTGVCSDWAQANAFISGYSNSSHKKFNTMEAVDFLIVETIDV